MNIVWLQQKARGDWASLSGGYLYNAQMVAHLRRRGHRVRVATAWRPAWASTCDVCVEDALGASAQTLKRADVPWLGLVHVPAALLSGKTTTREARLFRRWSGAVFVSAATKADTEALYSLHLPTFIVPPGMNVESRRAKRPRVAKRLELLAVGHVLPTKGFLELLEVLRRVKVPCRLRIAGDFTRDRRLTRELRDRIDTLGLTETVFLLGRVKEGGLSKLRAECDLAVVSSAYESFSLAAAEALAAGLPVVTWARGGIRDFVTARNGACVAPGDERSFAKVLESLAQDAARLRRLSRGAAMTSSHFATWEESARLFERALNSVRACSPT